MKFYPTVNILSNEKKELLKCLNSKNWSSFKGALNENDYEDVLNLDSISAEKLKDLEIRFLGGKYIRKLEANVAKKFKIKFCVSANSATSCLHMALASINVGPGDEVLVPSMSFNATATSVLYVNAIPKFVEVKKDTFCIDPEDIIKKITKNTKAIIVVHLGGNSADMQKILQISKKYNLKVIEDAAQSPGVKYKNKYLGTLGDIGVYSLTETKNITCGEGGLLVTNNKNFAKRSRLLRNHGEGVILNNLKKEDYENIVGMNYRLTELQASIAIHQFSYLDKVNRKRKENSDILLKGLEKFSHLLIPQKIEKHTEYFPYILKFIWRGNHIIKKEFLLKKLNNFGIPFTAGYSRMMHENPIFSKQIAYKNGWPYSYSKNKKLKKNYGKGSLPISENLNKNFLWFKYIHPPNTKKQMNFIISSFDKILK